MRSKAIIDGVTAAPTATYQPLPQDWIATPFRHWCKLVGISCSHAYAEAAAGHLKITKSGNRSLITHIESDRYLSLKNLARV